VSVLRHVGIVVADIEASLAFYRRHFGFEPVADAVERGPALAHQLGLPAVEVRTVKLQAPDGGPLLELLDFSSPPRQPRAPAGLNVAGLTHLALTVADAAQVYSGLCAAGCAVTAPPAASADGRVRMFFCADPDGVQLEIVEEARP